MSHPDFPVRSTPVTRHRVHPDIDEAMIDMVVETFYEKIRNDAQLGPVFNSRIEGRWPEHLIKMKDFWSSLMLTTGRYKGRPMQVHMQMGEVKPEDFNRWLELFRANAQEVCAQDIADLFISRAEKVATSFQLCMFYKDRVAAGDAFKSGEITGN